MPQIACNRGRSYGFSPETTGLVVIDMQREFLDPQGRYFMAEGRAIVPRVAALTAAAREAGVFVGHTREGYLPDGSDINPLKRERGSAGGEGPLGRALIRGEPGQDFLPECMPREGEPVFDKPGFSAFYRTDLETTLRKRGITHLIVCGVTTQCCVHSTLRDAVDRGFWCLTVEDCCAAVEPNLHEAAMALIYGEGHLFGWVSQADAVMAALAKEAA